MSTRLTSSVLAFLAAVTSAGAAQATSAVTVNNTAPKTISNSADGDWTESTKWGDFGANYSAGYVISANYNGSDKYEKVYGNVGGMMFGSNLDILDVSLKAKAGQSTTLKGDYFLSVFGVTLLNVSDLNITPSSALSRSGLDFDLVDWDLGPVSVGASVGYGLDGRSIEGCISANVDADISYVGVPLTFSAGGSGCLGLTVSATASYDSSSGKSSIDFTGKPYASLTAEGSAGVGTSDVSGGGYGELELLNVSVPITNSLIVTPTSSTSATMQYATSGYLTLSSLSGEFGLYVKFLFVKYTYTLFEWDGLTWANELLFTDSVPLAASPSLSISGKTIKASYSYTDANPEDGSVIKWYSATDSSGSNALWVGNGSNTSKTRDLQIADDNRYYRFCVTPSNGVNSGTEVCSSWKPVGRTVTYYWDGSYGGSSMTVAYERSKSGTCVNMSSLSSSWNDDASSYKIKANSSCTTTLHLYKDADCSGSEAIRTIAAGNYEYVSSIGGLLGDSWNDSVSSFSVVYCDSVSATDVSVGWYNATAQGNYTLNSASLFADEDSTYVWYRANDSSGSGSTQVSTSQDYTLGENDNGKYLKFCVTPNNGTTTGSQVCSSWTRVDGVTFWWDGSYGGSDFTFPYKQGSSGKCYNMSSVKSSSWNDDASSMKLVAPTGGSATITLYKDADCSGGSTSVSAAANNYLAISSLGGYFGSSWNDSVSSFKVTY